MTVGRPKPAIEYTAGDWFSVPLGDQKALGVVTHVGANRDFLGYYFRDSESGGDLSVLQPEQAIHVAVTADDAVCDGTWPLLGRRTTWQYDLPEFVSKVGSTLEYLVTLEPSNYLIEKRIRRRPPADEQMRPRVGLASRFAIQRSLLRRLGEEAVRVDAVRSEFDPDPVRDWLAGLSRNVTTEDVMNPIRTLDADSASYAEIDASQIAVAAISIVQEALSREGRPLPLVVEAWAQQVDVRDVDKAIISRVAQRLLHDGEWIDLERRADAHNPMLELLERVVREADPDPPSTTARTS
ncbi:MAG: hypothetical protein EPO00_05405 [Chloroflexota bacterium]|nr:MAG: hypothetical protein EPO00_05405 [Chloroflexota bacterium]